MPVEKVLKLHVSWLASQAESSNDLISKVGALGGHFEIVSQALLEVLLSLFRAFVLGGTKIPLCGDSTLQAAVEQIKLLVHKDRILLVVLVPLYKKLHLKVRYGVGCILEAKQTSVGGNIAGHFSFAGCRPLDLDGWRLAHAILNQVFWLTLFIELNPLGIPVKGGLIDSLHQFGHGGMELDSRLIQKSVDNQVGINAVVAMPYQLGEGEVANYLIESHGDEITSILNKN